MTPADDRHAIAVIQVLRRHALFPEQGLRRIFGALIAFLDDDFAFGQNVGFGQADVAHPVGLHRHHQAQTIGGNPLEISGVIMAGKGVVGAAVFRHGFGQFTAGQCVGGLEQQVFQKMGHTGCAGRFIRGPGPIPDHVHHDGGAVVFDHHDLHSVVQREIGDRIGVGLCAAGHGQRQGSDPCHHPRQARQGAPHGAGEWLWKRVGDGGQAHPGSSHLVGPRETRNTGNRLSSR